MPTYDHDLIVLGAGSGGVRCARMAGGFGASVAIVESSHLGGTCVNVGCVPKKLYMTGSRYPALAEDAAAYGWDFDVPKPRWRTLTRNVNAELRRLNDIYDRLLEKSGVHLVRGWGIVEDPHTVRIREDVLTAERLLIATGSWPWMPDIPGLEHVITSNEVFDLPELPEHILIIGAGYIGVEFAAIFQGYGAKVTLVNRHDTVLTGFDVDIRHHLCAELGKQGIRQHLHAKATAVERVGDKKRVTLDDGTVIEADLVMFATGRRPRTAGIGLEAAGVELDSKGAIVVDGGYRSSVASIFAVGDVTDRVQLTPVALAEGMWLARHWFTDTNPAPVEYDNIPSAVFSRPHVGTVGLTESQAREAGHEVVIYRASFRALPHTVSGRDERTMVKLVVDGGSDRVLGVHMVGAEAGEMIQGLAVALKAGATKAHFDRTIGIHPTVAEEFVTLRTPAQ